MANLNTNVSTRDLIVSEIKIISSNGKIKDLNQGPLYNAINIYENINSSIVNGSIQIIDGIGMYSDLGIHGNEYLYITFSRPGETSAGERYTKAFRIYKSSFKKPADKSQIQTYVLYFCSEEGVFSNQQTISRAFQGGNAAEYVYNICRYDLKVRQQKVDPNNFENSYGSNSFTLTRYKPFDAIQYLASRSYNANESTFVFFENKDGFNFLSLEKLFDRNQITTLKYSTAKYTSDQATAAFENANDMYDFTFDSAFNVFDRTQKGAFSSRLFTLDLVRQKYTRNDYSVLNAMNKNIMMDGYFPFNDTKNRNNRALYEEYESNIKFWLTNKERTNAPYFVNNGIRSNDTYIEQTIQQRNMQLSLLDNTKIRCVVPGNPNYSAGYLLEFEMPAFTPNGLNERVSDPYYTGKYLITAVRHVIVPGSLQTVLELSKNSVSAPFDLSTNDPQFKNAQKL